MDWKKITHDVLASGLTQVEIAKRIGCSQPTVAMLASGAQRSLRWEYGEKLRLLHKRVKARRPRVVEAPQ